jgi:hypothetical protein
VSPPEPDEHPGHDAAAGRDRGRGDGAAPGGRLSRNVANGGAADAIRTDVTAGADVIAASEGGTGTAGSRGGGPAADFSDDPAAARGGDASRG